MGDALRVHLMKAGDIPLDWVCDVCKQRMGKHLGGKVPKCPPPVSVQQVLVAYSDAYWNYTGSVFSVHPATVRLPEGL